MCIRRPSMVACVYFLRVYTFSPTATLVDVYSSILRLVWRRVYTSTSCQGSLLSSLGGTVVTADLKEKDSESQNDSRWRQRRHPELAYNRMSSTHDRPGRVKASKLAKDRTAPAVRPNILQYAIGGDMIPIVTPIEQSTCTRSDCSQLQMITGLSVTGSTDPDSRRSNPSLASHSRSRQASAHTSARVQPDLLVRPQLTTCR